MFDQFSRRGALVVIFLTAVIVGHPVVWASHLLQSDTNPDSFPLSTYPMFSSSVPEVYGLHHIVAVGRDVPEVRVSKRYWTVGGMNQARGQLDKAVTAYRRSGRRQDEVLRGFCEKAARRIARLDGAAREEFAGTTKVQIVYSKYHLKKYFLSKDKDPISRRVVLSCPILRSPSERAGAEP